MKLPRWLPFKEGSDDELDVEVGIEGWRDMTVCFDANGLYLAGQYGGEFRQRESDEAECNKNGRGGQMTWGGNFIVSYDQSEQKSPAHSAPQSDCTCGYYALFTPRGPWMVSAVVRVQAAGRTLKASQGFRAARIRIEEIFLPVDSPYTKMLAPLLHDQFDVPVLTTEELLWRLASPSKSSEPSPAKLP